MDAVFREPNCIIIDSFHGEVIKLQSQISEVLRIFLYTRLKIKEKEILVQVSSPVACFISKLQQFELPSFHTAWQNRNAISLEKKSLCSWLSAVKPFWMVEHVSMYTDASSQVERKSFFRKTEHQIFLLISGGHTCVRKLNAHMASPYKALQWCVKCFSK